MNAIESPVTVWIRDTRTGEERSSKDWPSAGAIGYDAAWWSDGNGGCDCNRHLVFSPDGSRDDYWDGATAALSPDESFCLGQYRYRITRVEPMPEGMELADFNEGYP